MRPWITALLGAATALGAAWPTSLAAQSPAPNERSWTLGEVRTKPVRIGKRDKHARPFARLGAYYTQETRPDQADRVREGLTMRLGLGADGRMQSWRGELAAVEAFAGGYNAQWDDDFFVPIAIAESGFDLRLGGVTLAEFRADKELAFGKVAEKVFGKKKKSFKMGPVRVRMRTKVYAALGAKIGGTVFLSAPGQPPGSDLGIGAALVVKAGAAAAGKIYSGSRKFKVGGTARFGLLDARNDYTIGIKQSGLDGQVRVKFSAISMKLKVWAKAWFFKAKRTLLNWRGAGFTLTAG